MSSPYQLQRRLYLLYSITFSNYVSLQMSSGSDRCHGHAHITLLRPRGFLSPSHQSGIGLVTSDDSFLFPPLSPRRVPPCGRTLPPPPLPPPLLGSPPAPPVPRYSSVREREMRGPFRISFLFSSFLRLFSSSLRIFWKASAV